MKFLKHYFQEIKDPNILKRSLKISLLIGSVLTIINHYATFLKFEAVELQVIPLLLTYLVPFLVSSYSTIKSKYSFIPGNISQINVDLKCKDCDDVTISLSKGDVIPNCDKCIGRKVWVPVIGEQSQISAKSNFFKLNPSPVMRVSGQGLILDVNEAFLKTCNQNPVGDQISVYLKNINRSLIASCIQEEKTVNIVEKLKDRTFQFEVRGVKESGSIQIYGSDITELEGIKTELQSLSHFPKLNPAPVLRLTRDGDIINANPAAKTLLSSDIVGKNIKALLKEVQEIDFNDVINKNELYEFTHKIGERSFKCTLRGIDDLGVCQLYGADVTEIGNVKTELESLSHFPNLNPAPVIRIAANGDIVNANPAAKTLFNNVIEGQNVYEILSEISLIDWGSAISNNQIKHFIQTIEGKVFRWTLRGIEKFNVCQILQK